MKSVLAETLAASPHPTRPLAIAFEPMRMADVDEVLAIEQRAYPWPWSRGNFTVSIASGYRCQLLRRGDAVLGYSVALRGVDEAHLLNITVHPDHQRAGLGRQLLDELCVWASADKLHWLWLEVRESNLRAIALYQRYGLVQVGERKNYYPAAASKREHAWVMNMQLTDTCAP